MDKDPHIGRERGGERVRDGVQEYRRTERE